MNEFCIVTTCMGRLSQLQQTLPTFVSQPGMSVCVVDYSCPEGTGDWVERTHPGVKVVRVTGQSRFCLAHARNVGAQATESRWLCFIDADTQLRPEFAETLRSIVHEGHFYRAQPFHPELCGAVICHREDYDQIGGYDEAMQGWGGEDRDLYARLELLGVIESAFPASALQLLSHGDELRVRYHDIKIRDVSAAINDHYCEAKLDLMKLTDRPLSMGERTQLYELITQLYRETFGTGGGSREFRLAYRQKSTPLGGSLRSAITYTLSLPALQRA